MKFLSCDWGSSTLRIRLFDADQNKVLAIYSGDQGIIKTHKECREQERVEFYKGKLKNYISILQSSVNEDLFSLPIVISGMASSTIGIQSLPYTRLPFDINGAALETLVIKGSAALANEILLISGVSSDADVMRGEETELIGFTSFEENAPDGVYLFPGTHSKHIFVKNKSAGSFRTFMTGEVFALLCEHSILKSAMHPGEFGDPENSHAFSDGVKRSGDQNLLNQFFSLRASELFSLRSATANYFFLSGLLIGYELSSLEMETGSAIYLCAQGKILELYKTALMVLGHENKTRTFSTQRSDIAVAVGQYRIYQNNR